MKTLPWADPNKCVPCGGTGLAIIHVPSAMYTCGFTSRAITCPGCLGSGRKMPQPIDHKMLATGEAL